MYATFIYTYPVRIFVFISVANVPAALGRTDHFTAGAKPETKDFGKPLVNDPTSHDLISHDHSTYGDRNLSHSGNFVLSRRKRCFFSLMAAASVASAVNSGCSNTRNRKRRKWRRKKKRRRPTTTRRPRMTTWKRKMTTRKRKMTTRKRKMTTWKLTTTTPEPTTKKLQQMSQMDELQYTLEFDRIVVDGTPRYDLHNPTVIRNVKWKIRSNGVLVLEWIHPFTGAKIHIPARGGDVIINTETGERYLIYVDRNGKTFLILDRSNPFVETSDLTLIINKYRELARTKNWGQLVISGSPKYNKPEAIYVTNRVKKFHTTGILILEFVHPLTGEKMIVPAEGSDLYIEPETSRSFVIFVDNRGRTLMILKGTESFDTTKFKKVDYDRPDEMAKFGTVVKNGSPTFDLSNAITIEKTQILINSEGETMIYFVHPITEQAIVIPLDGGDEYLVPGSNRVYVIFVDDKHRTLLIFKTVDRTFKKQEPKRRIVSINTNVDFMLSKYERIDRELHWGTPARNGVPKYDIPGAIVIDNVENVIDEQGFLLVRFVHPITKQMILVPYDGYDEFVMHDTLKSYIIFVDSRGQTLLISKSKDRLKPGSMAVHVGPVVNITFGDPNSTTPGSLVKRGIPKYDLSNAILVEEARKILDPEGSLMIEFVNPFTGQVIKVPTNDADVYVDKATSEKFLIFVDSEKRTLMIPEDPEIPKITTVRPTEGMYKKSPNEYYGRIVINGIPKYDITNALIVMKTKIIEKNGIPKLQFIHPLNGKKVIIPAGVGDEYVVPKTSQVFLIFVDSEGRTLLILKSTDDTASKTPNIDTTDEAIKKYNEFIRPMNWGSIVVAGKPSYDPLNAIVVDHGTTIIGTDGNLMIRFVHPITDQKIDIPIYGGDEYMDPKTYRVFRIFVDSRGQTLFVPKDMNSLMDVPSRVTSGTLTDGELQSFIEKYRIISNKKNWGSVVIHGVPSYDPTNAIKVFATRYKTIGDRGFPIIEFKHPITGRQIYVPQRGTQEYVDMETSRVFVIFVDDQGQTLLISKDPVPNGSDFTNGASTQIVPGFDEPWKKPKQDQHTYSAVLIEHAQTKYRADGSAVLVFEHPASHKQIEILVSALDVYFDPETGKSFYIFVDDENRKYLILKDSQPERFLTTPMLKGRSLPKFGWLVVNGSPRHDVKHAIYINHTMHRINSKNIPVISFVHPITFKNIDLPINEGDVFVDSNNNTFLIFVDLEGRTFLIPDESQRPSRVKEGRGYHNKSSNINTNLNKNLYFSRSRRLATKEGTSV